MQNLNAIQIAAIVFFALLVGASILFAFITGHIGSPF